MIKCPECHQNVSDKAAKCVHCCTDFNQLMQQRCLECETVLDQDVSVCNSCGCPITSKKKNNECSISSSRVGST